MLCTFDENARKEIMKQRMRMLSAIFSFNELYFLCFRLEKINRLETRSGQYSTLSELQRLFFKSKCNISFAETDNIDNEHAKV